MVNIDHSGKMKLEWGKNNKEMKMIKKMFSSGAKNRHAYGLYNRTGTLRLIDLLVSHIPWCMLV